MQSRIRQILRGFVLALLRMRVVSGVARRVVVVVRRWVPIPSRIQNAIPVHGKVVISLPGVDDFVFDMDGVAYGSLYWDGTVATDTPTLNVVCELMKHCEAAFDVGAYVGLYTLVMAAHPRRAAIYAFEPQPRARDRLLSSIRANAFQHVRVEGAVVTDYDGEAELYIPAVGPYASVDASTVQGYRPNTYPLRVPATTLDTYVATHDVARVGLLKIDTEATEPRVLAGARHLIDRDRPAIICEVLSQAAEDELGAFFSERDYRYYQIVPAGLVPQATIQRDQTFENLNYLLLPGENAHLIRDVPVVPAVTAFQG